MLAVLSIGIAGCESVVLKTGIETADIYINGQAIDGKGFERSLKSCMPAGETVIAS